MPWKADAAPKARARMRVENFIVTRERIHFNGDILEGF